MEWITARSIRRVIKRVFARGLPLIPRGGRPGQSLPAWRLPGQMCPVPVPVWPMQGPSVGHKTQAIILRSNGKPSLTTATTLAEATPEPSTPAKNGAGQDARSAIDNGPRLPLRTVYLFFAAAILLAAAVPIYLGLALPALPGYLGQAGVILALASLAYLIADYLRRLRQDDETLRLRLKEASEASGRDDLTQLPNRRFFYERLQQELERARKRRVPLAVLMLDMDDLKAINDEHGHQLGDMVLVHLARVLNQVARNQDITARLGGDEFALILPETDSRGAEAVAARLYRELGQNPIWINQNTVVSIDVSIGISGFPWSGDRMEAIIYQADASLYSNKLARKGHNNYKSAQERGNLASAVIEVLSSALDIRHRLTHRHSHRVALLAAALAGELGLSAKDVHIIRQAAALHDIGKIGVPDSVLSKSTALDTDEWTEMRRHCELGYQILKDIEILSDAADIVYAHHERYDGTGYPRGLKNYEIPLGARIFAVVDAFDAMTSSRPYREPIPQEEALGEIALKGSSQFDPLVVAAFLKFMQNNSASEGMDQQDST